MRTLLLKRLLISPEGAEWLWDLGYLSGTQRKRTGEGERGWGKEGDKRGGEGEGGVAWGDRGEGRLKACVPDLGQNAASPPQISWDTGTYPMERESW